LKKYQSLLFYFAMFDSDMEHLQLELHYLED